MRESDWERERCTEIEREGKRDKGRKTREEGQGECDRARVSVRDRESWGESN